LSSLEKKCREWQIKQADKAIRLYRYFQASVKHRSIKNSNSLDEQWRYAADEMVRMLRLKQRALRTEEAYMQRLRSFYRHASVQTTMIYTRVAKSNCLGIISPFDQ
jgi:hypothetical protein